MAEAYLNSMAPDRFEASSAGISPGALNPLAVKVMAEDGIDISRNSTKSVEAFLSRGDFFDIIITACEPAAKSCPVFPGTNVLHWTFDDPSKVSGTETEKLAKVRKIRDEIRLKIVKWIKEYKNEN